MATLKLRGALGYEIDLVIDPLPGCEAWGPAGVPTVQVINLGEVDEIVQLLEEVEYTFALANADQVLSIEPSELFSRSRESWATGRLRPRRRTGIVRIEAHLVGGDVALGEVEVRSRKLEYRTQYRWMLERISNEAVELAMLPFAASRTRLSADLSASPETLYHRFEFLRAKLESEEFLDAIDQIRYRPHSSYVDELQVVSTRKPIRGSRQLARQLRRTGPRWRPARPIREFETIPLEIERPMHRSTLDTVPNRFLRFVIEDWVLLVEQVEAALLAMKLDNQELPAQRRGLHEVDVVRLQIEELKRVPAIRDASVQTVFPAANTVVRSRAGYREFFSAFQATNAHALLQWDQDMDARSAGQHDVATLYEYWVFLEVVRVVESLDFDVDRSALVSLSDGRLTLNLRKAKEVVVEASGRVLGQDVTIQLWFNRTFSFSENPNPHAQGSWSVQLRPDISIEIGCPQQAARTWLHFDAKYKVVNYTQDFVDEADGDSRPKSVVSDDLQKMHAYRDAIRSSAGAYVLYPGDEDVQRKQYHELLPGLGAFCLRPTEGGQADTFSAAALASFIADVVEHVAASGTNHERSRYWTDTAHKDSAVPTPRREFLEMPPADTVVLLGYVRSIEHRRSIAHLGCYNLRADQYRSGSVPVDSPGLSATFLVLYGSSGTSATVHRMTRKVTLRRAEDLRLEGYEPQGDLYLCLGFEDEVVMEFDQREIADFASSRSESFGAPVYATWADLEAAGG